MDEKTLAFRRHLVLAEQKAQDDYDKTVIALSGGALGISFAFIENFVDSSAMSATSCLFSAWVSWGLSLLLVLASFFSSHLALQKAIEQVDKDDGTDKTDLGGFWNRMTKFANAAGGILFVVGLGFLLVFVRLNLGG